MLGYGYKGRAQNKVRSNLIDRRCHLKTVRCVFMAILDSAANYTWLRIFKAVDSLATSRSILTFGRAWRRAYWTIPGNSEAPLGLAYLSFRSSPTHRFKCAFGSVSWCVKCTLARCCATSLSILTFGGAGRRAYLMTPAKFEGATPVSHIFRSSRHRRHIVFSARACRAVSNAPSLERSCATSGSYYCCVCLPTGILSKNTSIR